jgi:hypothetical protein
VLQRVQQRAGIADRITQQQTAAGGFVMGLLVHDIRGERCVIATARRPIGPEGGVPITGGVML